MTNEQAAQTLETLAAWYRAETTWYGRLREKNPANLQAEACDAGAACLRREAAYHERLARAIGAVGEPAADQGSFDPRLRQAPITGTDTGTS